MNKLYLCLILGLFSLVLTVSVEAYLDCTVSSCPSGYEDQGTYCAGSVCSRICVQSVCNESTWTEVSTNSAGWDLSGSANANVQDNTASYQPTDKSKCYQFHFVPPPASSGNIDMLVANHASCTTEGAAGLSVGGSEGWFENMTIYLNYGSVGGYESHKIVPARGSADNDADFNYITDMATPGTIFCANNSVACTQSSVGSDGCGTGCYDQGTQAHAHQGWLDDVGSNEATLFNNNECGFSSAQINRYTPFYMNVSEGDMYLTHNNQTCDRINEAPFVTTVDIIPPIPNAGQDLECDFNYSDPENFLEQNSTFEWWKDGVAQNIDARILDKGNLTINDKWACSITPSDGLIFGNETISNNITILTTVKDPSFNIEGSHIWEESGYYGDKEEFLYFNQELQDFLDSCVPDAEGFCDINLFFTSNDTGVLDLTHLEIFYTTPTQLVFNLTNLTASFSNTIVEFQIVNNEATVGNFSWNVDFGDGVLINSTQNTTLNVGEDVFVLAQHTYVSAGQYNITATAIGNITDSEIITIEVT